jgi:hypothetical protein
MALRPSTVDVLLALLKHADGSELLVLMEPVNVLALLHADGWTDEAVRAALEKEKKLPGELLLGLFERGRTADELLAILGPAAVAAVEAERNKPAAPALEAVSPPTAKAPASLAPAADDTRSPAPATAPLARVGVGSGRPQVAGLVLILAAALLPSMLVVLDVNIALALLRLGAPTVLGSIALLGAVGGALATTPSRPRWPVAISGAVASIGGFAAVIGYALWTSRMGRTSLLRIEIALVCMMGMLPAAGLAALLGRIAAPRA